jgi:hypothetical protein
VSHELPRITRINPDDAEDVRLWSLALGFSPASVYAAVASVGPDALAVQAYLRGAGGRLDDKPRE